MAEIAQQDTDGPLARLPRAVGLTSQARKVRDQTLGLSGGSRAIDAFEHDAVDYLLKPIDTDELVGCIQRVREQLPQSPPQQAGQAMIGINVKDGIIFIRTADLIRLEASGSYTEFYLDNNVKHVASRPMKEYEALLDPAVFFRCHN